MFVCRRERVIDALGTGRSWGWRPAPLVTVLRQHDIRFVVIGGVAKRVYEASHVPPEDLDVLLSFATPGERIARAISALLHEFPTDAGTTGYFARGLDDGASLKVRTAVGALHVLGRDLPTTEKVAGVERRESIIAARRWVLVDRAWTPICTRADLIYLESISAALD